MHKCCKVKEKKSGVSDNVEKNMFLSRYAIIFELKVYFDNLNNHLKEITITLLG